MDVNKNNKENTNTTVTNINISAPDTQPTQPSSSSGGSKTKIIVALITALFAAFAAIAVAMIENPKESLPTQTSEAMVVEQPPQILTNTPPKTDIPALPPTSVWTPSAEYPGADWQRGCISADIWQVYPSDRILLGDVVKDGCYQLLEYGISAHQGNLAFVRQKVRQTEIYGILVPIPDNVEIEFSLRVNRLDNAEVWMGIVKSPNSRAGSYLVAKKDAYFDLVEIKRDFPSKLNENYHVRYNQDYYHFKFDIEGNLWNIWRNGTPQAMYSGINLMFTPRYLFIGYRAYPSNGISGTVDVRISDLTIEEK